MSLQTESLELESNLPGLDIKSLLYGQTAREDAKLFGRLPHLALETFAEGRQHSANGNWKEAIHSFRKLVRLAPSANTYFLLGSVYFLAGEFNKATKYMEKAIKKAPNRFLYHRTLGAIFIRQGKIAKALKPIKKAIQLNPNDAISYNHLGFIQSNLRNWRQAAQAFENAIRLDEDIALSHILLAGAYIELGLAHETEQENFFTKARKHLKLYQKFGETHIHAQNAIGQSYYLLGHPEDAERAFMKVLESDSNNSDALDGLRLIKEDQLAQMLYESGSLRRINKRITDFTPYQKRVPIKIKGKPLSETIIEERR